MVRHAGTVAAADRTTGLGLPITLFNGKSLDGGSRLDVATTSGARSAASCRTRAAAPISSRFRNLTTSGCTWSSACPKTRTAASTCGAATSSRSTTPPASSHRHIISAGSTGLLHRARTWPELPASGIDGCHARGPDAHLRAERHDRHLQPGRFRELPAARSTAPKLIPDRCCSRAITVPSTTATS